MKLVAADNLRQRLLPPIDRFHSIEQVPKDARSGVTLWRKLIPGQGYCEAKSGYVCQRPAAAGPGSETVGRYTSIKKNSLEPNKKFKIK